ncbi:MAG: hypothetical protein M1823_000649 [Watsoniomyces obsoletus]|nr:MAG: hypothetical protein M1823_000649 [Watsoniomyces obsoletus]
MFTLDPISFQTRQALLILNLQNDFLSRDGKLPVKEPSSYLERIKDLVPAFRSHGDVVWVRTEFEGERIVNDVEGEGENVVTEIDLPLRARGEEEAPAQVRETYLSSNGDEQSRMCCAPGTEGAAMSPCAMKLVDDTFDQTVITSHYSAFHAPELLPLLRGGLVTELCICGLISNVSVYATALDAVRHGFSVTLVEDCLGYRSQARHSEGMRQMVEFMGAEVMNSEELIRDVGQPGRAGAQIAAPSELSGSPVEQAALEAFGNGPSKKPKLKPTESHSTDSGISIPDHHSEHSKDLAIPSNEPTSKAPRRRTPSHDPDRGLEIRSRERSPVEGTTDRRPAVPPRTSSAAPGKKASKGSGSSKKSSPSKRGAADLATLSTDSLSAASGSTSDATETIITPVTPASDKPRLAPVSRTPPAPTLGPGDAIGEGDSKIVHHLLSSPLRDQAYERLQEEVRFRSMYHRGGEVPRLVAVQGEVAEDGSIPVYRHPADESPPLSAFSPIVSKMREEVQKILGHPVNHVLIQFYRDGQDYISEHSDKTLDIARGSSIANVSIGAQRTMVLRTKKSIQGDSAPTVGEDNPRDEVGQTGTTRPRKVQRIIMPHNSIFILGPQTNAKWLHGIRQDRRAADDKSSEERSYGASRISLTFRQIGTFLNPRTNLIWGQGATSKDRHSASKVVEGGTPEAERMVLAFGRENQESDFVWDAVYGRGFDALDILPNRPKLYLSRHPLVNMQVQLHLAEVGVDYEVQEGHNSVDQQNHNHNHNHHNNANPSSTTSNPNSNSTTNSRPLSHHRLSDDPNMPIPTSSSSEHGTSIRFIDKDHDRSETAGELPVMFYIEKYYRPNNSGAYGTQHTRIEIATMFNRIAQSASLMTCWDRFCQLTTLPRPRSSSSTSSTFSSGTSSNVDRLAAEKALHRELAAWEERAARFVHMGADCFTVADSAFWPILNEIVTKWADWDEHVFQRLSRYHDLVKKRESVKKLMEGVCKDCNVGGGDAAAGGGSGGGGDSGGGGEKADVEAAKGGSVSSSGESTATVNTAVDTVDDTGRSTGANGK